jgi:hypothetical protein
MAEHDAKDHKRYVFFVDGKKFETEKSSLTGAEIKGTAGVTPTYQLMLEEPGDDPDKPIADSEGVAMKEGMHFYVVPPATFGWR